jgi:hypothetical protein
MPSAAIPAFVTRKMWVVIEITRRLAYNRYIVNCTVPPRKCVNRNVVDESDLVIIMMLLLDLLLKTCSSCWEVAHPVIVVSILVRTMVVQMKMMM